jgi:hypothetical protein
MPRHAPPGVHLGAEITAEAADPPRRVQLRILGDETRGYLLIGLLALPHEADTEFWFATLDEAKEAAAAAGVAPAAWAEITDASQVAPGPRPRPRPAAPRLAP